MNKNERVLIIVIALMLIGVGAIIFVSYTQESASPILMEQPEQEQPSDESFTVDDASEDTTILQATFNSVTAQGGIEMTLFDSQERQVYALSETASIKKRVTNPETYEYAESDISISDIPLESPVFATVNESGELISIIWLTV